MNAYQWTVLFAAWLGWGFDIFDSLLFNYVAPNAVPVLLDIPLGIARRARRDAAMDRHSHLAAAGRLGGRRHHVRPRRRSARPHADAAADDADVRDRHGGVRVCAEHGDARVLPHHRVARHRRRVGRRRGDGGRSRSRAAPRRSGRAALHGRAARAVSRDHRHLSGAGRVLRRQPGSGVALCVPVRPAARPPSRSSCGCS